MPFNLSKNSDMKLSGSFIQATYWNIGKISVDDINQKVTLEVMGYADKTSHDSDKSSYLMSQIVSYPTPGCGSYPFDPSYMVANFAQGGPMAYALAAESLVAADPYFAGATQV